jgi:hypothetical protein
MGPITKTLRIYQDLVVSVLIIAFTIGGLFIGVVPAIQKILDQVETTRQLSVELAGLQKKLDILNAIDEDQLRADLVTVLSAVPADKSLPTVFSTVEGVAQQVGVGILDQTISAVGGVASQSGTQTALEKQLGSRVLPFNVTVQGPISAIQQFIAQSTNVRRLLRLRTFSISFPKENEVLRVSLQMDAFYEPFPTNLGSLSSSLTPLSEKEQGLVTQLASFPLVGQAAGGELPPAALGPGKANPFSP